MIITHHFNNGKSMTLCEIKFPLGTSLNDGVYHLCTMETTNVTCEDCILLNFADMSIEDE